MQKSNMVRTDVRRRLYRRFFNKEDNEYDRTLDFSEIGIEGKVKVRDLWKHQDEGEAEASLSYKIPGRSCKIVRLTKSE